MPATGINVYSFGLKPEDHQPSGTCNMSRIDNATLQLTLTAASVASSATCKIRVYAVSYNVLRIMSGIDELLPSRKVSCLTCSRMSHVKENSLSSLVFFSI